MTERISYCRSLNVMDGHGEVTLVFAYDRISVVVASRDNLGFLAGF